MSWLALIAGAGVLSAAALPIYQEAKRSPTPDASPKAKLSKGETYYRWYGPDNGPVAVCVHGLSTPSIAYHEFAQNMALLGFRVLVYDLYGRGASDAPRGRQTPAFFERQLLDLLADQGLDRDITLIGYSMGGSIAAHVAAENPERFRELVLLAPAGMGEELGRMARLCARVPVLGDWLFSLLYPQHLLAGIQSDSSAPPAVLRHQEAELQRRGFIRSVLSSLRGTLNRPLEKTHRKLAETGLPVTAVWGQVDTVIPLRSMGTLVQWNRNAHQIVIDGAGHGLPYTHALDVVEHLLDDE